jgi:hypothetical protein
VQARQKQGNTASVCVVIDELPYLADGELGLLTTLQHGWDDHKHRPNLKLFLAGSYVAFMELFLGEDDGVGNTRTSPRTSSLYKT